MELKSPDYYRDLSELLGNKIVEEDIVAEPRIRIWVSHLSKQAGAHEHYPVRVEQHDGRVWKLLFLSSGKGWAKAGTKLL